MNFEKLIQYIENTHKSLQKHVISSVNQFTVIRSWLTGYYIVEFEQNGEDRAKYGEKLFETLSGELKKKGLKGFSVTNFRLFRQFYMLYPQIHQPVAGKLLYIRLAPRFSVVTKIM